MSENLTFEEKIEKSKNLVFESYYKASVIDKIVQVRDARATDENFRKLYFRTYIPREWFIQKDIISDHVFTQFGSNLALSEKKYIVNEILKNEEIERSTVEEIEFNDLRVTSLSLIAQGNNPTVLLMPIGYFTKLHTDWRDNRYLQIRTFEDINISGQNYKIFWSNKYMPFSEVVFIDRNFGEWVSKPNIKERLFVEISESDRVDQLDLLIYTTLKFRILDTSRITILQKSSM